MASAIQQAAEIAGLAATRGQSRAAIYRQRVGQLRAIAEAETVERVRDSLLDLADQYEELAAQLG